MKVIEIKPGMRSRNGRIPAQTSMISLFGVRLSLLATVLIVLAGCSSRTPEAGAPGAINYNWDVRPILSENCFQCHGPDVRARKAGLRMDVGELATQELPENPGKYAIVPGRPERSELITRITTDNVDDRMPPASTHKNLSAVQINILRQWIATGAKYQPHWSFIPPEPVAPPRVTTSATQTDGGIDNFILARLEDEGLAPAPDADKETLINRVSFTLTGLPPTLSDVDAFLTDDRPDAYEKFVDRLLSSSQYAEHMASYWMDLARWSESDGFLDDHHDRFLWPWRDWVIQAFQRNMPFDEFGVWQLAGDLLPNATPEQILATAFLRLGKRSTENGAIADEYKAEYMVERTDNAVGTAFLGLTVGCARCHDHKYDPISQRDYYALGAFFNSNDEPGVYAPGYSGIQDGPTLGWPTDDQRTRIEVAARKVAELETAYAAVRLEGQNAAQPAVNSLLQTWDQEIPKRLRQSIAKSMVAHYPFDSVRAVALADFPPEPPRRMAPQSLTELKYGSVGEPKKAPPVNNADLPAQIAARVARTYNSGELMVSEAVPPNVPPAFIQAPIIREGQKGQALYFSETNKGFVGRDIGSYDRTQPFTIDFWFYAAEAYDNVPLLNRRSEQNAGRTGYSLSIVDGHLLVTLTHSPPANMIALESIASFPEKKWTHVTLAYDGSSRAAGTLVYIDGARAEMTVQHDTLTQSMLPWTSGDQLDPFVGLAFGTRFREKAPVGSAIDELRVFGRQLTALEVAFLQDENLVLKTGGPEERRTALAEFLVATDDKVRNAFAALTQARETHNQLVTAVPQVLVMRDAPTQTPTFVLNRGVYSDHGDRVSPRGLETVFPWDRSLPENRLGLAKWLFDPRNPLTARVFVNRVWQMHFGRGIVETSEDFGSQGSVPTHPELLDWLTLRFIETGWDIKALHRAIVLSATYRQSSAVSDELLARDPANSLYARGPRWRMTAEMIRDHALAASGLLVDKVGGSSVKPYQPSGIWNPLNSFYEYPDAATLPPADHHRRTLYSFIKRNAVHPSLKIFDFKNRTESIARRRSSNTPLQALVLMNDPQYIEVYRALATLALAAAPDERSTIARIYRLATRATPSAEIVDRLNSYYDEQYATFAANPENANALLNVGATTSNVSADAIKLAAMTNVAGVVMNSPDAYSIR